MSLSNKTKARLERLEAAHLPQPGCSMTITWWREHRHRPLEEWPITAEHRARIEQVRAQVVETMAIFEEDENS